MKKWLLVGIWFFFILFSCKTSEQDQAKKKNGDELLFRKQIISIDHTSLTNEDLKNFIKIQYPDLAEKKDDQKMLSRLFDLFVKHQLVLYKADQEKLTVSEDEYANYLKTAEIAKNGGATERRSIEDLIKVQKYLMIDVYKDIAVSEKEIEDYYQAHMENYRKKDEIYLHQILIDNRDKAIKIRGELVNSPDKFAEIASKTSASADAQAGGAMGYFEKGVLPKEMEDVVFSLKIGEISPIVESAYGFHIFKVTQKKGQRLLNMAMVRNEIENMLLSEKFNSAYDRFLKQIKGELQVKIIYDNLYFAYQTSNSGESNES
jgi:parvulin-like peptidyl-prolyl isomerase